MNDLLIANLFRGSVSTIFNMILIFSLAELKYSKKVTVIFSSITGGFIMLTTSYFYIFHDLTTFARFDIFIWLVVGLGFKYLSMDSMMKWLFNVVTVLNVALFVMIISYVLSRMLPYPMYTNTVVRIVVYTIFIILFKKFVYPLYRQVVDRWYQFLLVTVGILLNYIYILVSSPDIAEGITQNLILLLLFSALTFLVYGTIFWSFGSIIREYEFRIAKEQAKLHENLLTSQLAAHEEFVETSKRHRHDLRHHNQIIMEYLKHDDAKGAEEYLYLYDISLIETATKNYCKNYIANALLRLYAQKSQAEQIVFVANANIPENITITPPELGSILSNILENALEACRRAKIEGRFITFTAEIEDDSLKIELKNTARDKVEIRNNLPVSTKNGGGIGMKSVLHIVESYHGMLYFKQKDDAFITQIILPV